MITLPREKLLPALNAVRQATERRNTIPILANMLLSADSGSLTLTATNLDLEMRATVEAGMTGKARLTLPSFLLCDAVRKLPDGAEVSIEAEDQFATIRAGRSKFRLPVLPASDFPVIGEGDLTHRFSLGGAELAEILAMTGFAISTEETRYYLNGIYLHAAAVDGADRLVAVATDGHRLAKVSALLPAGAQGMPGIILPRQTIGVLEKILDDKPVEIALSETKIMFSTGQATLLSKLIDGSFPDYARVIPAGNGNRFRVGKPDLHAAVDRVGTISAGGRAMRFGFSADTLRLSATNPDTGDAEDHVAAERLDGDDVEIGFNHRYCLDMVAACPAQALDFDLGDPGTPALVRPAEPHALSPLFVIMPMRI